MADQPLVVPMPPPPSEEQVCDIPAGSINRGEIGADGDQQKADELPAIPSPNDE